MQCPDCGGRTRVIHLERRPDGAHRWRRCNVCDQLSRSIEIPYTPPEDHLVGGAVLTPQNVRDIRSRVAAGDLQLDVAADYGVCTNTVSDIVNRKSWKNID